MDALDRSRLREELQDTQFVNRALIITLLDQIDTLETRLEVRNHDLRHRILHYLTRQATKYPTQEGIVVEATHESIAEAVYATREGVSKVLGELRRERLLKTKYRRIVLLRPLSDYDTFLEAA